MKKLLKAERTKVMFGLLCLCILAMPFASATANVVITEIMYHPVSGIDEDDFLELYNTGATEVNLANWQIDGLAFTFGPGASIGPNAYLVLARDANQFQATYGFAADYNFVGNLKNSGELLQIINASGIVIDEVSYVDTPPWPVTTDGLGPSLERIIPDSDGNTPRNWHASTDAAGHTAGALNSVNAASLPPWISNVQHSNTPDTPVTVTALIEDAQTVNLTYIINFGTPVAISMLDDGLNGDGDANDGIYGAIIPAQPLNTLVRYCIDVTGPTGSMGLPRDDDTVSYTGTVTENDESIVTALPIFHWFITPADYADALAHYDTDETESALIYYDGTLYDGVQCRVRGGSSASWPKKNWKFYFPQGHDFSAPGWIDLPVDQFDMQASYADKTYMHEYLSAVMLEDAGSPYCRSFHTRLYQNGEFFGLYINLEHPDDDYFERHHLDEEAGALYKAVTGNASDCRYFPLAQLPTYYEKHRPDNSDYNDLHDLLYGINNLTGQAKRDFMFDNLDIPRLLNYWAVLVAIHDNDAIAKNYYLYRDTSGTGRWYILPWDKDLTWGRNYQGAVLNDDIWADVDSISGRTNVSPSHPLFGDQTHQKYDYLWHRLIHALFFETDIRQMYFRRLRTIMDNQLQPPGTPYEERKIEKQIDEMAIFLDTEAEMDVSRWFVWGQYQTIDQAAQIMKDQYLEPRRTHLFVTHRVADEIPEAQISQPQIVINEIMYNPVDGNDNEFIELYNPSSTEAIDMSGWRFSGVDLDFAPGTVLLPQSYLVVVKNDAQFRATYGSGLFVAAQYDGILDNDGENLVLKDSQGNKIDEVRYGNVSPWYPSTSGGGPSLELIDASQNNNHVMNWAPSASAGGTPGAVNSTAGTSQFVPDLRINELLLRNGLTNTDEQNEHESWIEIYNASPNSIDLGGMYLTDNYSNPTKWEIPNGTVLDSGDWMIFWADAEPNDGPMHTNFSLSLSGGYVALYTNSGGNVDFLNYTYLPMDISYGRYPDGIITAGARREFTTPTPAAQNYIAAPRVILNEYNPVAGLNYLKENGTDTYWGRIQGNGGDWFELVVMEDHLDMREWRFVVKDNTGGASQQVYILTLTNDAIWSDLRAGTIITVSEDLPDNIGNYDPENGKYWINVQAKNGASGTYITASDFQVSHDNWQLTIRDNTGARVFGPAGEGIKPVSAISDTEVFALREDPGNLINERADYGGSASSTFGSENIYTDGEQDFSELRYMPDGIAPMPDPPVWSTLPTTTSGTTITMMTAAASDPAGVEYYFNNITDPNHDSGWQGRPYFKDKYLQSNAVYSYRVKVRDKSEAQNETAWSATASAITPLLSSPPVSGTITMNTSSSARTSATFSHTVAAGDNRLLVVSVMTGGAEAVNSITYAGNSLTKVFDSIKPSNGNYGCKIEHWYLVAPPVGTANIVVTFETSTDPSGIAAVNFTGVNQSSPIGAISGKNATSGTDISLNITTRDANSIIFGAATGYGADTNPYTPGSGITEMWDSDTGSSTSYDIGLWGGKRPAPTPGVYTFNITANVSDDWAIGLLEIEAAEVSVSPAGQASNPNPMNGAINVDMDADLGWTAGANTKLHKVYFGTDSILDETEFKGDQTGKTYDLDILLPNTTYYWRIDEENAAGITTGDVWSFTTNTLVPDVFNIIQADANTAIITAGLTIGTATVQCSDTIPAGNVISQDPNAGTTVLLGTAVDLVISRGRPSVPNVTGMDEAEAIAAINAVNDISYGSSSTACSNIVAAGDCISQSAVGTVDCGTVIDLVVSSGQPYVPPVTGQSEANAIANINAVAHISYGSSTAACSDTVAAGDCISQSVVGAAACGTVVDLTVSYGQPVVPDVTGLAKAVAIATINAVADISYGSSEGQHSDTVPAGDCISQSAVGTVSCGTVVNLVISVGPCAAVVPDVTGMSETAAIAAINAEPNLAYGSSTIQCSDTVADGDVISQSDIGTVSCGTVIDLVVSSGQPSAPDVTGMAEAAAIAAINTVSDISYGTSTAQFSDTVPTGYCISQSAVGTVDCGTVIDLVISAGKLISSNGTGGGDWHTGTTWLGGSVPTATDNVMIQENDVITLAADGNCTSLIMNTGSNLIITAGGPIPGTSWSLDPASTIEFDTVTPTSWVNPTFGNLIFDLSSNYALPESITVAGNLDILRSTLRGIGVASGTNSHYVAGNITVSGNGRITAVNQTNPTSASCTWNIGGNLTIGASSNRIQLYESAGPHTGSAVFNIDGDLTVGSSSYIMLKSSSGTSADYPEGIINLKGDFINNGTVNINSASSGTSDGLSINFVGTSPQNWSGSGDFSITAFSANINIDNPAGVILCKPQDISTRMVMILTNGNLIATMPNWLAITHGSLVGGSSSSYINGTLRRRIEAGPQSVFFPIGDTTAYTPMNLDFNSVSTENYIIVSTAQGMHSQISTSGLNSSKTLNRYYTTLNDGVIFDTATVTFNFDPADVIGGADPTQYVVKQFDIDTWWTTPTTANPLATSIQATGITSFSDFAIGEFLPKIISGYVTEVDANIPVPGVSIDANNSGGSDITDAYGYYQLTVLHGWSGTVTPSKTGLTFEPNSITYTNVTQNQNGQNYVSLHPIITSNGTGGGDWHTGTTWLGGVVPASTDNVMIQENDVVTLASAGSCTNLTMNAGAKLTITAGGPVPGTSWLLDPASTIEFNTVVPDSWVNPVFGNLVFDVPNYSLQTGITVTGDLNILNNTLRGIGTTSGTNIHNVAGNVNISGTGRISAVNQSNPTTANCTWNIGGDLNLGSNANRIQLYESAGPHTGSAVFNINGDLTVGTSSYIMLKSSSGTTTDYPEGIINLKGDLVQNGTISINSIVSGTSDGLTINFVGSNPQDWSGNGDFSISAFTANMNINNPAGVTLSRPQDISTNTIVTLTNGKLTTTNINLLRITNGFLIGGSPSSYINGPLGYRFTSGPQNKEYPIGDTTVYTPVNVELENVISTGTITAGTTPGMHPQIAASGLISDKILDRYYTVTNTTTTFDGGATITFNFDPTDVTGGADPTQYIVRKFDTDTWTTSVTANPLLTSIQATGITSFSDFAIGQISRMTIFGHVTEPDVNIPVEGVLAEATNGGGSDITDANGYYELTVDYGWSGTVTPARAHYTFEPNAMVYNNITANTNDNYTAILDTFIISGYITDPNFVPLADVLVMPDNNGGPFTTKYYDGGYDITDVNGFYEAIVDYNWTGNITPSRYAHAFQPSSIAYADVIHDQNGQDYTGILLTYKITGYIKNTCQVPIPGVFVDANNLSLSDITDVNGFYEVWVDTNWSGTITPDKILYTFDPNIQVYAAVNQDITDQNYAAVNIYDLDCDSLIGYGDVEVIVDNWLLTGPNVPGDICKDANDIVNFLDWADFALIW